MATESSIATGTRLFRLVRVYCSYWYKAVQISEGLL